MTGILFVLLVLAMASLFTSAVWSVSVRAPAAKGRGRWAGFIGVVLLAYIVVPGVLAARGVLDRWDRLPPPALVLIGALTISTVGIAFSPLGARLTEGISLAGLVAFQVFRLPVELLLHRLHTEGLVPVQMTYLGRNFDILTAITAVVVALYLRFGRRAPALVLAWNVLGLVLLVNIVTVAVLSTPTSFRQFTGDPPNLLPGMFPYVWLPTVLVQAALFGHLLVFRALARARAPAAVPAIPG